MTYKKRSDFNKSTISNLHRHSTQTSLSQAKNAAPPREKISYSVIHAIPGRIRFRIHRLTKDSEYADKLKLVIEYTPNIKDVRVNQTAGSIVINYQPDKIPDQQMRSHLIYLIQTAPYIDLPSQATAKSIVGAIFDALVDLIDSIRNINKARTAIVHQRPKTNTVERVLSTAKTGMKWLKSVITFGLPKNSSVSPPQISPSPQNSFQVVEELQDRYVLAPKILQKVVFVAGLGIIVCVLYFATISYVS